MSSPGFERSMPSSERRQTHALDRAATVIGLIHLQMFTYLFVYYVSTTLSLPHCTHCCVMTQLVCVSTELVRPCKATIVAYFMALSRLLPAECENSPVICIGVLTDIGTGHTRIKGAILTSCASLTKSSGESYVCMNAIC
jgi:hypothetical protein